MGTKRKAVAIANESAAVARRRTNYLTERPASDKLYAFVTEREGLPNGATWVTAECIDASWLDAAWAALTAWPLGGIFATSVDDADGEALLASASAMVLNMIQMCAEWWSDHAFHVFGGHAPERSTLELLLGGRDPWQVEVGTWYEVELVPARNNLTSCVHTVMLYGGPPHQKPPQPKSIAWWDVVPLAAAPDVSQAALRLLHRIHDLPPPLPPMPLGTPPVGTGPLLPVKRRPRRAPGAAEGARRATRRTRPSFRARPPATSPAAGQRGACRSQVRRPAADLGHGVAPHGCGRDPGQRGWGAGRCAPTSMSARRGVSTPRALRGRFRRR